MQYYYMKLHVHCIYLVLTRAPFFVLILIFFPLLFARLVFVATVLHVMATRALYTTTVAIWSPLPPVSGAIPAM